MSFSPLPILYTDKVSPQTRRVLEDRLEVASDHPAFFTEPEFALLQRLAEAMLPQKQVGTEVALVRQIDTRLHKGEGAGWRYDSLPPDPEAYRAALRLIKDLILSSEAGVSTVEAGKEDKLSLLSLLDSIQKKELDTAFFPLSRWLEGFKFELVKAWLAHPRTMAVLGYDGFADERLQPQPVAPGGVR